MPKPKTKEVGFSRVATETSPGVWQWKVGDHEWSYQLGSGFNTFLKVDGSWVPVVYCAKLELAAMFAEGFAAGVHSSKQGK